MRCQLKERDCFERQIVKKQNEIRCSGTGGNKKEQSKQQQHLFTDKSDRPSSVLQMFWLILGTDLEILV
ncbi:hypothetical protein TYRP_021584 [Tyrophagus putrescentiae]|nr:hypothetical protein TYRP_021584 [Tyrophagus putrescentiae]